MVENGTMEEKSAACEPCPDSTCPVPPEAEDAAPAPGRSQQMQELERLQARLAELKSTIDCNRKRLWRIVEEEDLPAELLEMFYNALQCNETAASDLQAQVDALREALSLKPEEEPEPEEPMPE